MTELLKTYSQWHKERKFVAVTLLYPKKKNKEIYGYIMDIDEENGRILIYDTDAKKVVITTFYEIDDIRLAGQSKISAPFALKNSPSTA